MFAVIPVSDYADSPAVPFLFHFRPTPEQIEKELGLDDPDHLWAEPWALTETNENCGATWFKWENEGEEISACVYEVKPSDSAVRPVS